MGFALHNIPIIDFSIELCQRMFPKYKTKLLLPELANASRHLDKLLFANISKNVSFTLKIVGYFFVEGRISHLFHLKLFSLFVIFSEIIKCFWKICQYFLYVKKIVLIMINIIVTVSVIKFFDYTFYLHDGVTYYYSSFSLYEIS